MQVHRGPVGAPPIKPSGVEFSLHFVLVFSFGKGGKILLVLTNVGQLQWPRQLASGGFHPIG